MSGFDNIIEAKCNELKVNNEFYSKKLNEIKENFCLDNKYNFILKDETLLLIEFETGEFYNDGNPKHNHIEIVFVKSCGYNDDYFFSINPYAPGLEPIDSNYLINYCELVELICSNEEFRNAIKNLMHEYAKKNENIKNEICDIKEKLTSLIQN